MVSKNTNKGELRRHMSRLISEREADISVRGEKLKVWHAGKIVTLSKCPILFDSKLRYTQPPPYIGDECCVTCSIS